MLYSSGYHEKVVEGSDSSAMLVQKSGCLARQDDSARTVQVVCCSAVVQKMDPCWAHVARAVRASCMVDSMVGSCRAHLNSLGQHFSLVQTSG